MNEKYYDYVAPKRPVIEKLGTVKCDVIESTPFVFNGRLYRLEYYRAGRHNEKNPTSTTWMQIFDVEADELVTSLAEDHHFGTAFVDEGYVYVAANREAAAGSRFGTWGGDTIDIYRSADLTAWELYSTVELKGYELFNEGICKKDGVYTLLVEVSEPLPFTLRFLQSKDLKNWTLLPEEYLFQKGRYAGGPSIYTIDGDPHYYVTYLEACPGKFYMNAIARSTDLINWEYSPINPMLMFGDEDRKIANEKLTEHERARIDRALNINASDLEICDYKGKTVIYYSWGCQRGIEFLAEARYDGSVKEFLQGWF